MLGLGIANAQAQRGVITLLPNPSVTTWRDFSVIGLTCAWRDCSVIWSVIGALLECFLTVFDRFWLIGGGLVEP